MVVLLWFRRDLRLSDNPALAAAVAQKARIVPVFIWDPPRVWSLGEASRWWLHHSLTAHGRNLRRKGSRLIMRCGESTQVLPELAAETGAQAVYWNRCYEPEELKQEEGVVKALKRAGITIQRFHDQLLHKPGEIKTKSGKPFQVFTPFWRKARAGMLSIRTQPQPRRIGAPKKWPSSLSPAALNLEPRLAWTQGLKAAWTPGEQGARARLRALQRKTMASYEGLRERPDLLGTSRLSPHLHFGEISVRQVEKAVQAVISRSRRGKAGGARAFSRQLYWREFASDLLYHFQQLDRKPLREDFKRFPWRRDKRALKAWQQGRTGYPTVDAGMRQLWLSGWMHNRVRMLVASFLVKDLMIHWLEGARWFWDTLVDADLANNTLGWQWVAGCGADAAPYFRIFNPVTQGKRYDPNGDYVRQWIPELSRVSSRWIHCPWKAPKEELKKSGVLLGSDYPHPIVNHDVARKRALAAFRKMRGGRT